MKINFDFSLVNSPKVLFTPQLKQILNVLRMNSQELYEYIEEQLESNPVLEITEDSFFSDEEYIVPEDQLQWYDFRDKRASQAMEAEETFEEEEPSNILLSTGISLKEYLLLQLQTTDLSRDQLPIAEYLIDNIDENGYLVSKLSDAAAFFNVPVQEVEKVLLTMQTFDPPGIFARNLKECLLIQIRQFKNIDRGAVILVEKYLDELAEDKISEIAQRSGFDEKRLTYLFDFIKSLEPKPGREFYNISDLKRLVPDIFIKKINGKYEVFHNERITPDMRISSYYRRMLKQDIGEDCKRFIQEKVCSAKHLIRCLKLRKRALKLVAEFITRKEAEFFDKGKQYLQRLELSAAAKELSMHEFILKTIIEGKYIQCCWGNMEMTEFIKG